MQETQETQVSLLGREDNLEEGMATHFGILAQKIPWTEEPGGLQSIGLQRGRHDWSNRVQAWFCHLTQETQVSSLGREDNLEEGIATHSGILA